MQLVVDNGSRKRRPGSHPCVGQHTALSSTPSRFNILPFPPCPWPADGGDHWPLAGVRLDPVLGPAKDANWLLAVSSRATAATAPGQSREKGLGESFETLHGIAYWALGTESIYCRMTAEFARYQMCQTLDSALQEICGDCSSTGLGAAVLQAGICGVCMLSWSQDTCPFVSVRGNFTRL